jgi:conjugative relaxase-like TrwC/TraI family protein
MLTISKPLSSGQAQRYHEESFSNARENYYSQGKTIQGEWHGKLAERWGLSGTVSEEHFARLAEGQHPLTGEQLVRHRAAYEYVNLDGKTIRTMEHRAGWDATFAAPKSVSLTALVAGDERVRQAHRESVEVALNALEPYVQARLGGNQLAETTCQWVAARFEHDSSRPVNGYAAPQLHTHVVVFNITERESGETRAMQPRELYRSQQYATAVYRSELALRLRTFGYEVEQSASGAPEIKGYSKEYLEASSPRRREIQEQLAADGLSSAEAAEIAQHRTRHAKLDITHEEMQRRHLEMAGKYGDQPQLVVKVAEERAQHFAPENEIETGRTIDKALNYARERNLEREAVAGERDLMRDALKRSMGRASFAQVRKEFEYEIERHGFIEVESHRQQAARSFTSEEMIAREHDNIRIMRAGQDRYQAMVSPESRQTIQESFGHLRPSQQQAVQQVLGGHDQISALQGAAGAGKTTSLSVIREAAEYAGYVVQGLAPTSRAVHQLAEAGIEAGTLQSYLARQARTETPQRHLYVLDESSLSSTRQMNEFFHRLRQQDRVLLVGDVRQHEAVEAGKPFQQLQEAGMRTARLDEIIRQKDEALKETVEHLARGQTRDAIRNLDLQGRVHEIVDRAERLATIATEYVERSQRTLVISPDNDSRRELNVLIHEERQKRGQLAGQHKQRVLEPRQDMTGADRAWAVKYEAGDILRYSKGSRTAGIQAGEYSRVESIDQNRNLLTVKRDNGEQATYDPRRLQGVSVYREAEREFSTGDRIQFTAPAREFHVANRELGTIHGVEQDGELLIRTDSGRLLHFNVKEHPHLDYGYAVTSHSSQGETTDRVLIHVDTELGEQLVNQRMAYVAVSRARYDAQIYTDNAAELAIRLSREHTRSTAIGSGQHQQHEQGRGLTHEHGNGHALDQSSAGHAHENVAAHDSPQESHGHAHGEGHGHQGHAGGYGMGEGVGE